MLQLAENIKKYRKLRGLSQHEIADKLGIPRTTYATYEATIEPKTSVLMKIAKILEVTIDDLQNDNSLTDTETPETYLEKRRKLKQASTGPYMAPFVPVKAQAGYVKAIDQSFYLDTLEKFALPPGVNPQGAVWRWWQVEGDSMESNDGRGGLKDGDIVLTSQVPYEDWKSNLRNFYVYVLVTNERVLIKRLFCKNDLEWVLISENEDKYEQQLIPADSVKELWVFRRKLDDAVPPTKMFEIKV